MNQKITDTRPATAAPSTVDPANIAKPEPTYSERFMATALKQIQAEAGNGLVLTDYQKTLMQHMFLKIDSAMKEAEAKRRDPNKPAITWANVNMTKLAIDAANRVQLGLDALLPATVYPIAYLNGKTQKYDMDLRVGYRGKLYYRLESATERPVDVRLELVYETDDFRVIKRSGGASVAASDDYEFAVKQPFARGKIVGGFAYFLYDDARKNFLFTMGADKFDKAKGKAMSQDFWGPYYEEMCYKTLLLRATDNLMPDPKKINGYAAAYAAVESQDNSEERRPADDPGAHEPIDIPGEFEEPEPERPAIAQNPAAVEQQQIGLSPVAGF